MKSVGAKCQDCKKEKVQALVELQGKDILPIVKELCYDCVQKQQGFLSIRWLTKWTNPRELPSPESR